MENNKIAEGNNLFLWTKKRKKILQKQQVCHV